MTSKISKKGKNIRVRQDERGDYTLTWTHPVYGEVFVVIREIDHDEEDCQKFIFMDVNHLSRDLTEDETNRVAEDSKDIWLSVLCIVPKIRKSVK